MVLLGGSLAWLLDKGLLQGLLEHLLVGLLECLHCLPTVFIFLILMNFILF